MQGIDPLIQSLQSNGERAQILGDLPDFGGLRWTPDSFLQFRLTAIDYMRSVTAAYRSIGSIILTKTYHPIRELLMLVLV